jgi:hypothetical protein
MAPASHGNTLYLGDNALGSSTDSHHHVERGLEELPDARQRLIYDLQAVVTGAENFPGGLENNNLYVSPLPRILEACRDFFFHFAAHGIPLVGPIQSERSDTILFVFLIKYELVSHNLFLPHLFLAQIERLENPRLEDFS